MKNKKQHIHPERIDISSRHETKTTHNTMGKMKNYDLGTNKGHGLRDPDMGREISYKSINLTGGTSK